MKRESVNQLEFKKEYLNKWLEQNKKAHKILPYVQKDLALTDWAIDAISSIPSSVDDRLIAILDDKFKNNYEYLTHYLPQIPDYDEKAILSVAATTASGYAGLYSFIDNVSNANATEAINFSEKYINEYHVLNEQYSFHSEVRKLIERLHDLNILQRFDNAQNLYFTFLNGNIARTALAMELRTLVDGLKGYLYKKARKHPSENMKWEKMSERLIKNKNDDYLLSELKDQEAVFSNIKEKLSIIGKNREGTHTSKMENIWTEVLNHIYTVLGLTNIC